MNPLTKLRLGLVIAVLKLTVDIGIAVLLVWIIAEGGIHITIK